MKKIEGELYTPFQKNVSHYSGNPFSNDFKKVTSKEWTKNKGTVNRVRASEGFPVKSFRELMNQVALVTIKNSRYEMFYRGQSKDYLNNQAKMYKDRVKKSIIYPSICRPNLNEKGQLKYSIRKHTITKRYKLMFKFIEYIKQESGRKYMDEYLMALFQHYEIVQTPLIDLTQSLRVAATFALKKNNNGFIYVFGLPFPNQSISYFIDFNIVLLKLQNIVEPSALRPRYQEGYLAGKFPISNEKTMGDDLSNRMIAKFRIDDTDGSFWDDSFLPMPEEILYPKDDEIEETLKNYLSDFLKNNSIE